MASSLARYRFPECLLTFSMRFPGANEGALVALFNAAKLWHIRIRLASAVVVWSVSVFGAMTIGLSALILSGSMGRMMSASRSLLTCSCAAWSSAGEKFFLFNANTSSYSRIKSSTFDRSLADRSSEIRMAFSTCSCLVPPVVFTSSSGAGEFRSSNRYADGILPVMLRSLAD